MSRPDPSGCGFTSVTGSSMPFSASSELGRAPLRSRDRGLELAPAGPLGSFERLEHLAVVLPVFEQPWGRNRSRRFAVHSRKYRSLPAASDKSYSDEQMKEY